jgi:hypothetical protein
VRPLYLVAWGITRLAFLLLWAFALPIGELNVWLKQRAQA